MTTAILAEGRQAAPCIPLDQPEVACSTEVPQLRGEPHRFGRALQEPACTADDMLQMVRRISERIEARAVLNTRLYVDGLLVTFEHPLEQVFLLQECEATLEDYVRGVTRRLGGREFCIVIDDAAVLNDDVWERMRLLAAQIVRQNGYPTGRIKYGAMIGTCAFSPFGIHRDKFHVFTVLAGSPNKTMLTWAPDALAPLRGAVYRGAIISKDPARMKDIASQGTRWCLTSPTDVLYMPPGYWHVSWQDADSPFQASLGLSYVPEETPAVDLSELVARELRRALESPLSSLKLNGTRAEHATDGGALDRSVSLSAQNEVALDLARQALSPGGGVMEAVDAALRMRTVRRLSGLVESGHTKDLEPVFPKGRRCEVVGEDAYVRLTTEIFHTTIAGQLVLAINGEALVVPHPCTDFLEAVRRLEQGAVVAVRELTASGDDQVHRFLDFAASVRALVVV